MYNRPRCTRLGVVAIEGTYLTRAEVICVQGDDVSVTRDLVLLLDSGDWV